MDDKILSKNPLFADMKEEDIVAMLSCLQAVEKVYKKGDIIYAFGDSAEAMGLILSGSIHIENDDVWGNKNILSRVSKGQVFAEAYACIPGTHMLVNAVATEDTTVLFLDIKKVLHTCPAACSHHSRLIQNLLTVLARKNLNLTQKIFHTSQKSIRGKLLSYLSDQSMEQGSSQFEIPFNRQQLADYLGIDRSAMSNELSKMHREGYLSYEKNRFNLIKIPIN